MLVQHILDHVETALPQIRLLVDVIPHLGKMAERFLAADIHAGVDQDLSLQNFFVQFLLRLTPQILAGAVGQLDRFGFVLILFLCCLSHKAFSFLLTPCDTAPS